MILDRLASRALRRRALASLALFGLLSSSQATWATMPYPGSSPPETDAGLLAHLVELTREIEEGVRLGDKEAVARRALPEMLLVNRDGKTYTRDELLAELVPPRPGYDLRFQVLEPKLLRNGDAALLTFLLDEYLTIYGADVSTVYRCNFLYFRRDGRWQLALFEYFEKPVDPAVAAVDPATYDGLEGSYEVAPGRRVTRVWREGEKLMSRRDEGKPVELLPLAVDRFFLPGVEGELFFERDAEGRGARFVFRRNWKDLVAHRVPRGAAAPAADGGGG